MLKYGLIIIIIITIFVIVPSFLYPGERPCVRAKFDTGLYGDACKKGGQSAAKEAAKTFLKESKKNNPAMDCKSCHTKLAPDYPLKKDGLFQFKKLGGK